MSTKRIASASSILEWSNQLPKLPNVTPDGLRLDESGEDAGWQDLEPGHVGAGGEGQGPEHDKIQQMLKPQAKDGANIDQAQQPKQMSSPTATAPALPVTPGAEKESDKQVWTRTAKPGQAEKEEEGEPEDDQEEDEQDGEEGGEENGEGEKDGEGDGEEDGEDEKEESVSADEVLFALDEEKNVVVSEQGAELMDSLVTLLEAEGVEIEEGVGFEDLVEGIGEVLGDSAMSMNPERRQFLEKAYKALSAWMASNQ